MNLDEWHAVLESEPLTGSQLGAILGEFRRLGLDGDADRAERLAVTAALAGLAELDSTRSLTMGEAGQAFAALRRCEDRSDLPETAPPEPAASPAAPEPGPALASPGQLRLADCLQLIAGSGRSAGWLRDHDRMSIQATSLTVSRQGDGFEIVFENTAAQAAVRLDRALMTYLSRRVAAALEPGGERPA